MSCKICKNSNEFEPQGFSLGRWWLIDNHFEVKYLSVAGRSGTCAKKWPEGWTRWLLAAVVFGIIFLSCRAMGSGVVLSWIPSSDTNVTGYEIYYGTTSGVYTNSIVTGDVTNTAVNGLTPGVTYYFNAVSLD